MFKIIYDTLLEYTKKFDSQAVIKRLRFLLETLDINTNIIHDLLQMKTASYVVHTKLPKKGKRISRWSIQQNLEIGAKKYKKRIGSHCCTKLNFSIFHRALIYWFTIMPFLSPI